MTKYKLLALDLDGTLLGSDGRVAADVRQAVADACRAGLAVCLATGRSYQESEGIWRQLDFSAGSAEPMVVVGGAMVSEPASGRTLYQKAIPADLAGAFADAINDHGLVAMGLVDGWRYDVDYLVTERGDHCAASRDWFAKMKVRVRRAASLADADMPVVRISAVADGADPTGLAEALSARFGRQLNVRAVRAPNYGVTIVEAHALGADKMTALRYVGQPRRMGAGEMVAVGDDVNDLPMVAGAGLGAAMAHAPQTLKDAADVVVSNGLADFIHRLIDGKFDGRPGRGGGM